MSSTPLLSTPGAGIQLVFHSDFNNDDPVVPVRIGPMVGHHMRNGVDRNGRSPKPLFNLNAAAADSAACSP